VVRVRVPGQLRGYTGGADCVEVEGRTLGDVLRALDEAYPGFRFRVIDEQGRVRRHMLVYVGEEREEDLGAAVPEGAEVFLVGALSGG